MTRAVQKAAQRLGFKWSAIIYGGVGISVGFFVHLQRAGFDGFLEQWFQWLTFTVLAGASGFLLAFMVCCMIVPYEIYAETESKRAEAVNKLDSITGSEPGQLEVNLGGTSEDERWLFIDIQSNKPTPIEARIVSSTPAIPGLSTPIILGLAEEPGDDHPFLNTKGRIGLLLRTYQANDVVRGVQIVPANRRAISLTPNTDYEFTISVRVNGEELDRKKYRLQWHGRSSPLLKAM